MQSQRRHEYRFGWIGHSLGLIASALSGSLLQTIALTMATAGGGVTEPTTAEAAVINLLLGAVAGAMAMAAVGILIDAASGKG